VQRTDLDRTLCRDVRDDEAVTVDGALVKVHI
jgi:hypothetical protein